MIAFKRLSKLPLTPEYQRTCRGAAAAELQRVVEVQGRATSPSLVRSLPLRGWSFCTHIYVVYYFNLNKYPCSNRSYLIGALDYVLITTGDYITWGRVI